MSAAVLSATCRAHKNSVRTCHPPVSRTWNIYLRSENCPFHADHLREQQQSKSTKWLGLYMPLEHPWNLKICSCGERDNNLLTTGARGTEQQM